MSTRLGLVLCVVVLLTGCGPAEDVDATHLTIVTTDSSLDHATALALAEYVTDQGAEVAIEQHDDPNAVYAALEAEDNAANHASVGVVTAHRDPDIEDQPLRVPDSLEVLTQAPAELGLVPAASTVTMARFAQHQDEDSDQPLAPACDEQTWWHAHTLDHEIDATVAALADQGCEPAFESIDRTDTETYVAMAQRLTVGHDTVALVYGVDPIIEDQGLATLDLGTEQWPTGHVVAVAEPDLEDPVVDHIAAVLEVLDGEAATSLLRGYHNSQTSSSDLTYSVNSAARYWLASYDLVDRDTVTNIFTAIE